MNEKKKPIAIALLFLVLGGIVLPCQNIFAADETQGPNPLGDFFNWIGGAAGAVVDATIGNFAKALVWAFSGILGTLGSWLLQAGQILLNWVISTDFMGVSMTGMDNPVIRFGWPITRDLANIFLLLGLVVIGLGIILGIEEYQVKKSLPKLIAIAILINFTLVICGFILDFANLLMNYLLNAGTLPSDLPALISTQVNAIKENNPYAAFAKMLIFFIFGIIGAITYFLYAMVFIGRYVFLWILIVFSPIAFVSKIFDGFKHVKQFFPSFFYWDEWWEKFIQWAVFGIYSAFFVFLAANLMIAIGQEQLGVPEPGGQLSFVGGLFAYLFPILLLLVGLFSLYETWKKGIETIPGMKGALEAGKMAVMLAATAGVGAAVGGGTAAMGAYQAGEGPVEAALIGAKGAAMGAITPEGRETGRRAAMRGLEAIRMAKPGQYEKDLQSQVSEEEKRLEKLDSSRLKEYAAGRVLTKEDATRRSGSLNVLAKRGDLDKDSMINLEKANAFGGLNTSEIIKHMPQVAQRLGRDTGKAVRGASPEQVVKNFQADALNSAEVLVAMNERQLKYLGTRGSAAQVNAVKQLATSPTGVVHPEIKKKEAELFAKATAAGANAQAKADYDNFLKVMKYLETDPNFQ